MATRYSRSSGGLDSFSILILGETGRGKTRLAVKIANALARATGPGRVTVLDFAPDVMGVGRPMQGLHGWVKVLRPPRLHAPRLESRGDCGRAWMYARENAVETSRLLESYLEDPTPVLVVNDLSIHLHAGDPGLLEEAIQASIVFVGNSYWGEVLRDECGIWERERGLIAGIMDRVDLVWRL